MGTCARGKRALSPPPHSGIGHQHTLPLAAVISANGAPVNQQQNQEPFRLRGGMFLFPYHSYRFLAPTHTVYLLLLKLGGW